MIVLTFFSVAVAGMRDMPLSGANPDPPEVARGAVVPPSPEWLPSGDRLLLDAGTQAALQDQLIP